MSTTAPGTLTYDVFVNDPPPQDGMLPNGEPKQFSPMASTLICGSEDAVLTDPRMTIDQARAPRSAPPAARQRTSVRRDRG